MSIRKIVVARGQYHDLSHDILITLNESDKVCDLINLSQTMVGTCHIATVEKVMPDINASIVKLENGMKAFIENKRLIPDKFILRHSAAKPVCQGDQFKIVVSQDPKQNKPASCFFLDINNKEKSQLDYIIDLITKKDSSDIQLILDSDLDYETGRAFRTYEDRDFSLWNLYGISGILDKALSKIIHLSNGGSILIETTAAMNVIDVNTATNSGRGDALTTNMLAAKEIARQLRLRSISGIIAVDFLKMSKTKQQELKDYIKEQLITDYGNPRLYSFTQLGLLEMTRSRTFSPIDEIF